MKPELKPCPFCGEEAYFERHGTNRQSCIVACGSCGCSLETGETGHNCGGMWNTRAAPQPQQQAGEHEPTDTQMLDWLIENEALICYSVTNNLYEVWFGIDNVETGKTAREAIKKAMRGKK